MRISKSNARKSMTDSVFSGFVNLMQDSFVKEIVRKRVKRKTEKVREPSEDFQQYLRSLGLFPERIWWGPMTLFPWKAEHLANEIKKRPPRHVLEVGGGSSTAIFAGLAQRYNFDVLTLENHKSSVDYIEHLLRDTECTDRVELVKCGFVQRAYPDGKRYWWYDVDLSKWDRKFDFVFIDGPMGRLVGRNGALSEVIPFMDANNRIYLDDSQRDHEKRCMDEWQAYFPSLRIESIPECFGLARLTFMHATN